MRIKHVILLFLSFLITIIIIGCEPVSVSVNDQGEVVFTRSEGVFYTNLKNGKINEIMWNYGEETVPVIARWSPDGKLIAFTMKENKDSQNTSINIINKSGKGLKKVYSGTSVITEMEWSLNGKYLTAAQVGSDTDMGVADIVLISIDDGMSKKVIKNTGDKHKWIGDNSFAALKIDEKNANNSEIFKGSLIKYDVNTQKQTVLINAIIAKKGGIDFSVKNQDIAFSAVTISKDDVSFTDEMKNEGLGYVYNVSSGKYKKIIDKAIGYIDYSPDDKKILLKTKEIGSYKNKVALEYYDTEKDKLVMLIENTTDSVTSGSAAVEVYPTWQNDNTVICWLLSNTYGSGGQSLQILTMDISSKKIKNHQPYIDLEILKILESKGGI